MHEPTGHKEFCRAQKYRKKIRRITNRTLTTRLRADVLPGHTYAYIHACYQIVNPESEIQSLARKRGCSEEMDTHKAEIYIFMGYEFPPWDPHMRMRYCTFREYRFRGDILLSLMWSERERKEVKRVKKDSFSVDRISTHFFPRSNFVHTAAIAR